MSRCDKGERRNRHLVGVAYPQIRVRDRNCCGTRRHGSTVYPDGRLRGAELRIAEGDNSRCPSSQRERMERGAIFVWRRGVAIKRNSVTTDFVIEIRLTDAHDSHGTRASVPDFSLKLDHKLPGGFIPYRYRHGRKWRHVRSVSRVASLNAAGGAHVRAPFALRLLPGLGYRVVAVRPVDRDRNDHHKYDGNNSPRLTLPGRGLPAKPMGIVNDQRRRFSLCHALTPSTTGVTVLRNSY